MATIGRREVLALPGLAAAVAALPGAAQPRGESRQFLFGAATAAHQIEGNNLNSDYWVLENIPSTGFPDRSGDACDSWNRWREDLALVRAMGLNAYRFSIEWARIEPEPGRFSAAMLDYYRRICAAAREVGIAPVVTFHHFTSPKWIAGMGGWENPDVADRYARYCDRAARALGDMIDWACTINEPNAQVNSYVVAKGQPFAREAQVRAEAAKAVGSDRFCAFFQGDSFKVRDVCLAAHAKGRDAIKAAAPHVKVGITLALQDLRAGPDGAELYRRIYDEARAPFYAAAAKDDFVGVQSYNRLYTGRDTYLPTPAGAFADAWNRDSAPDALAAVVREVHAKCGAPIFVTEHGINATDDTLRVRHLKPSLDALAGCVAEGIPVLGYIHWSLLDNFEWGSGYTPRFGLYAVDRTSFARTAKPSAREYARLVPLMRPGLERRG